MAAGFPENRSPTARRRQSAAPIPKTLEPPARWRGPDSRLERSLALGIPAALAALWFAVLWIVLAGHDRRVGAAVATLALLVGGTALHAWLKGSRLLAAFAIWTASLSLCAAASGWELAGLADSMTAAGVDTLRLAAYTAHLASTIWLLVALFGRDLASPRLRRESG